MNDKKVNPWIALMALLTMLAQAWATHEQSKQLAVESFQAQRQKESELNLATQYGEFVTKVLERCQCGGDE